MDRIVKEEIEIELRPYRTNRKESCCLRKSRKPLVYSLNESRAPPKINCYLASLNQVLIRAVWKVFIFMTFTTVYFRGFPFPSFPFPSLPIPSLSLLLTTLFNVPSLPIPSHSFPFSVTHHSFQCTFPILQLCNFVHSYFVFIWFYCSNLGLISKFNSRAVICKFPVFKVFRLMYVYSVGALH